MKPDTSGEMLMYIFLHCKLRLKYPSETGINETYEAFIKHLTETMKDYPTGYKGYKL